MQSNSENQLAGRVALVTGGARGIGYAVAEDFVRRGARVVIADSGAGIDGDHPNESVAREAANSLGDECVAFPEDIARPDAARRAVETATDHWGRLDLVVNCAAILRDHFIFKANPHDFDEVVRVNLAGAYYILAAAAPVMRQQGKDQPEDSPYLWGRIINIVSTAGFYGNYGQSAYASAKSGLLGLTRCAALDLARSRIAVNAVAPFACSRVTETISPANDEQAVYKERALKISPKYVATVISWLCSDAASNITGQLLGVRGREVFLFSQPRPIRSFEIDQRHWSVDALAANSSRHFTEAFVEVVTDLEEFSSEPAV